MVYSNRCDDRKRGLYDNAPLAVTYLGAVLVTMREPGHRFSFADFIPSDATVGIMVFYAVNVLFDLARKIVAGPGK